jgi:EpsI family protein
MINRRDMLVGALCLGSAGAALALEPRRRLSLLGEAKMADVLPTTVAGWSSQDVSDLVAPKEEGSLASRLYGQTVGRLYRQDGTGAEIMMLAAYGATQSNDLMLHRPESCYPAVGYRIVSSEATRVPLAQAAAIPARRLVAEAPDRREAIVYWARLGEHLPVDGRSQRLDRVKTALRGYVTDGLLMRFSGLEQDPAVAFARIEAFIPAFVRATPPAGRPALVGTQLASAIA